MLLISIHIRTRTRTRPVPQFPTLLFTPVLLTCAGRASIATRTGGDVRCSRSAGVGVRDEDFGVCNNEDWVGVVTRSEVVPDAVLGRTHRRAEDVPNAQRTQGTGHARGRRSNEGAVAATARVSRTGGGGDVGRSMINLDLAGIGTGWVHVALKSRLG